MTHYSCILLLCSVQALHAQDSIVVRTAPAQAAQADSVIQLDRMTVTATRTKRRLSDIPANVSIIGRKDIEISPARNVGDLLVNEPGVLVRRSAGMGEGIPGDISMRGVPSAYASTRTLILVDDIPVNVSGTPFLILNEIPVDAIERVEVVRGPFSSLYGANAFSGVVNVITREGNEKPRALFFGGLGNLSFFDAGLWSGWEGRTIGYAVNGGVRGIGNYLGRDSVLEQHGQTEKHLKADNFDYYDQRFMGKLRWWVNDRTNLTLQARYFHSDLGFGKTKYPQPPDSVYEDVATLGTKVVVGPMLNMKVNDRLDVKLGGYVRRLIGEFYNETMSHNAYDTTILAFGGDTVVYVQADWDSIRFSPSYWKAVSDDGQAMFQATLKTGAPGIMTAGMDYLYNRVDFQATVDRKTGAALEGFYDRKARISDVGVFLQDEISLFEQLKIVPGLRWDFHSIIGSVWSPKLGISANPAPWMHVRASAGRAFRAPALSELYLPELPIQPTVSIHADSTLKPEYITALDGGYDLIFLQGRLTPSVSIFYNRMTDLITPKITSTTLGFVNTGKVYVSFRNVSRAWSAGVEAGCAMALPDPLKGASVSANYAYTMSRDEVFDCPLDYAPAHKGGGRISYGRTTGPVFVSGSIEVTGVGTRQYLDWQAPAPATLADTVNWSFDIADLGTMRPKPHGLPPYWLTSASIRVGYRKFIWLALDGQNLFNILYEETGGIWGAGRVVSVKIGVEI